MIIIDTNITSELSKKEPDANVLAWFDTLSDHPFLTAVNVAELRRGVLALPDGKRKAQLEAFVSFVVEDSYQGHVLPFDHQSAEVYAQLAVQLTQSGKTIGVHDTMIAAIALTYDAQIATRNVKHFAPCGVTVINPFDL